MKQNLKTIDAHTLSRILIGFDQVINSRVSTTQQNNYPPHNLIQYNDTTYGIELAVAGFAKEEITVEVEQNCLIISGEKNSEPLSSEMVYIHRGLAARNFQQAFPLAEYMEVIGASVKDGVLKIDIERIVPDTIKPRQIQIK